MSAGSRPTTPAPGFDRVHTMTDFYDGPRAGVADFEGVPHVYELQHDDDSGHFRLSPISQEVLALALEDWAIWLRWEQAFHSGRTTLDTHPALPEDRARSIELAQMLKPLLVIDEAAVFRARAEFAPIEPPNADHRGWVPLQVRWERLPAAR